MQDSLNPLCINFLGHATRYLEDPSLPTKVWRIALADHLPRNRVCVPKSLHKDIYDL